ncbi:glycosyltransferase [Dactylosporangium sp. AC04546]|uniref:glycosyltransferase n=1 Tax=Dactylosporangium sp. AC04546 TaxID=2862460 RepID=UPI001EDEF66C|nr:glycosyltransferase [Dactylosporangium sp. AC04546]WVK78651.1 glycosyltransferase [Dactylosporangium sp. AC04546]
MSGSPHVDLPADENVPAGGPDSTLEVLLEPLPRFTIVIPTRNESDNVEPVLSRLHAVLTDAAVPADILFVDDSDDGTAETIRAAAVDDPDRIRVLHRPHGERRGGLGGAVAAGIRTARTPWVIVMDGDLQHPPEALPAVVESASTGADVVVASRYRGSGDAGGLDGPVRRLVSRLSGHLTKAAFPLRLRSVSDPMSGFFAVRREAVDPELRPDGFKILLEIIVRSRIRRIAEVPYTFQPRLAGESKASVREGVRFALHLARLRAHSAVRPSSRLARMLGFAAAGASGIAVNSALLWLFTHVLAMPYLAAAVASTQAAIVWNFAVIDRLVMPSAEHHARGRFGRFWLLNNALLPLHLAVLAGLVQGLHLHYLTANVAAIVAVFVVRYVAVSRWIYGGPGSALASGAGRMVLAVRRSARVRIVLACLFTMAAFPGVAGQVWADLRSRQPAASLVIPLVVAAALLVGRLRPPATEPEVHDRQVDGLIAAGLLGTAAALTVIGRDHAAPSAWQLLGAIAFLAGATVLLLGTRTAARLRWVLALPLVASLTPTPAMRDTGEWVLVNGAAVVSAPFADRLDTGALWVRYGGQPLVLSEAATPATVLPGALLSVLLAALCCSGATRRLLTRTLVAWAVVIATAVLGLVCALLVGRLFGPAAFRAATATGAPDVLLAATIAIFAWRWSRPATAPPAGGRHYLPRGRLAAAALALVAAGLGGSALAPVISMIIDHGTPH